MTEDLLPDKQEETMTTAHEPDKANEPHKAHEPHELYARLSSLLLTLWRNLFSRLDRYVMKKFLGTYFLSIMLIISVAVVFDFSEHSDKFTMNHAPFLKLVEYYANFIPFSSNLFSALFVFVA
jgi:hypothetical protein